jgi:DNA-directed RNA polymerase specialized sigma24 family protein
MSNTIENNRRLDYLYRKHHKWLLGAANNICKDREAAKEMVSELYLYLSQSINPKLWYEDSFNLQYCRLFIKTRFINKIKSENKMCEFTQKHDEIEEAYDVEFDKKLEDAYNDMIAELKRLESTKLWASSKLAQMYLLDDQMTLDKLANTIKISKSTAFLNTKKVRIHLKNTLKNPFTKEKE